jgi:hypothetical protein
MVSGMVVLVRSQVVVLLVSVAWLGAGGKELGMAPGVLIVQAGQTAGVKGSVEREVRREARRQRLQRPWVHFKRRGWDCGFGAPWEWFKATGRRHLEQGEVHWAVGLEAPSENEGCEVGVPRRVGDSGGVVGTSGVPDVAGLKWPPMSAPSVFEGCFSCLDGGGVSGMCVLGRANSGVRRLVWNSLTGVGDGEMGRAVLELSLPMVLQNTGAVWTS